MKVGNSSSWANIWSAPNKTIRILDIQYHLLQDLTDPADLPLVNLLWGPVLRSCRAYEGYQRLYVGRIEPEHVVEFLLLHPQFPRSVRFSLEAAAAAWPLLKGWPLCVSWARPIALGLVLGELRFRQLEQILADDLHAFLGNLQRRCGQVSRALQERYALRANRRPSR